MKEAAEEFARFAGEFTFEEPRIPVIANVTARPHGKEDVRELLVAQITSPVRWTDTIRYLTGLGVTDFRQLGPGSVLTGLLRRIRTEEAELQKAGENDPAPQAPDNIPPTADNGAQVTDTRPQPMDSTPPATGRITSEIWEAGHSERSTISNMHISQVRCSGESPRRNWSSPWAGPA